jgi:putative hydrolase of the HAD superfamily
VTGAGLQPSTSDGTEGTDKSAGSDPIVAVISDFGGVLTSPLVNAFLEYQELTGIAPEDFGAALGTVAARDGANPLYELESGRITEAHFLSKVGAELSGTLGREVTLHGFGTAFVESLRPNEPMIERMRELGGRGYKMAICTNNVREWEHLWRAKLPIDEIFEVVVDSGFVGTRKPEPKIYQLTLERLSVTANSALFIDDIEINCIAARELGMTAVHFRTTEQALNEIEAALSPR